MKRKINDIIKRYSRPFPCKNSTILTQLVSTYLLKSRYFLWPWLKYTKTGRAMLSTLLLYCIPLERGDVLQLSIFRLLPSFEVRFRELCACAFFVLFPLWARARVSIWCRRILAHARVSARCVLKFEHYWLVDILKLPRFTGHFLRTIISKH